MFLLKSIAQRVARRPLQFVISLIAVTVVTSSVFLTSSVTRSLVQAQEAYVGCLGDSGADLIAAPARATEEELEQQEFLWGEQADGVAIIDGMRRLSQSETVTAEGERVFCQQGLGMPIMAAGTVSPQDVERVASTQGVDRVAGVLDACYSISTATWPVTAEDDSLPTTATISETDMAALAARVAEDPEYARYADEKRVLTDKPEEDLTAADHVRLEELSWAMGYRRGTLYHQWRPDVFPAPKTKDEYVEIEPVSFGQEIIVCGTPPDTGFITQFSLQDGRTLEATDAGNRVAFLRDGYASELGVKTGDSITLVDLSYEVVGIGHTALGDSAPQVFVPLDVLQEDINATGKCNVLFIDLAPDADVERVRSDIAAAVPGLVVTDATDLSRILAPSVEGLTQIVAEFGTLLALVLAAAASLLLVILTGSEVAKRAGEIATLRAIGWSQRRVTLLLAGENLLLVGLGTLLGALGGYLVIGQLAQSAVADPGVANYISTQVLHQLTGSLPLGSSGAPLVAHASWQSLAWTIAAAVLLTAVATATLVRAMTRISPANALARR